MALGLKLPSGRPFERGHKKVGGRQRGTPNRITRSVKEFLAELVDDPEVQEAVRRRIIQKGDVAGFLGVAAHILGRPRESVQVETTPNMGKLLVMALQAKNESQRRERERARGEVAAGPPLPPGA